MLPINVHCGPVLRGHELHLAGLRVDGTSDDSIHADYSEHRSGKPVHPMVSLTYTLTPGLASDDLPDGREIDVEVTLDPPAEPAFSALCHAGGRRTRGWGGWRKYARRVWAVRSARRDEDDCFRPVPVWCHQRRSGPAG